jgi:hypothetical protein
MKKVLVAACVIVMAAAVNAIQVIASLTGPKSVIPKAPKGYGAARDEQTGDFLVLVPREYCGTNAPGDVVSLGHTTYGSQINGYCQEF